MKLGEQLVPKRTSRFLCRGEWLVIQSMCPKIGELTLIIRSFLVDLKKHGGEMDS